MDKSVEWRKVRGFTVVELLIVIVVIAILAAVIIVAFNNVQKQSVHSLLKKTAQDIAQAMQVEKVRSGSNDYPTSLPPGINLSGGVGAGLTRVVDPGTFCVNVTHTRHDDIFYFIANDSEPVNSLCDNEVIAHTSDYNAAAGGVPSINYGAMEASAALYGFKVASDDTWSNLTLSWDPNEEAVRWNIRSRIIGAETWNSHVISHGGLSSETSTHYQYSNSINGTDTSLSWHHQAAIPQPGTGREYKIRYQRSDSSYSDWSSAIIDRPSLPSIQNFKVEQNSTWSNITPSWNSLGVVGTYNGVNIQLRSRIVGTETWNSHVISHGGLYTETSTHYQYSNKVDGTATSLSWSSQSAIPQPGTGREYIIRVVTSNTDGSGGANQVGPWSSFIIDRPSLPSIQNFKVEQNSNWSNITLSWNSLGAVGSYNGVNIQLRSRIVGTETWNSHVISHGGLYTETSTHYQYSNKVDGTATSLSWSSQSAIPQPGTGREYIIRVVTSNTDGSGGALKEGPWTSFTLSR